jgi:hypothetical protein
MKRSWMNFWSYLKGLREITISLGKLVSVSRYETAPLRIRGTATLRIHHYKWEVIILTPFSFEFQMMHSL